jgi:glycosyltransferase involved in cell wall biosynthesis
MRVLQVLHDDERGGVQTLAAMIASGLSSPGFAFETVYLYPRPALPVFTKLACVFTMMRRIWRGDYDALVAYQSTASILVGAVGWLRGCRLRIVHQTCTPEETAAPLRLLDKLAGTLGLYSVNVANSAATEAAFAFYPARYRRAMVLIEHGIDAPEPTRPREATRRHFGLPADRPVILSVGRLVEQKNQEVLIEALARVPEAHLALAGGGQKHGAYRALATTLGVADRVHILGPLPSSDIADLYAAADLFAFPSVWETFGLAAVEAAMVGLPLVVGDLAVLREVLRIDGAEPVAFVNPRDVEGWCAAIRRPLATPSSSSVIAAFSRAMRHKYSQRRMIDEYVSLFDQRPSRGLRKPRAGGFAPSTDKAR